MIKRRIYSVIKHALFGRDIGPFEIKGGIAKNLKFIVNPETQSQRILGLCERELDPHFLNLAAGASTFIDIGASDGHYPIIVASLNSKAGIIGCEPIKEMHQMFMDNLSMNEIENPSRISWLSAFIGTKSTTLDSILQSAQAPVFCKIDVEGQEMDVLESGKIHMRDKVCSLIIETHSMELENSCIDFLGMNGFGTQVVKNAWWRLIIPEERPFAHNRWIVARK